MHKELIRKGTACSLYCLVDSDREPEYLAFMGMLKRIRPNDYNKVLKLIKLFVDMRTIWSDPNKVKPLRDGIYELKPSSQVRLFIVFEGDNVVILTHGTIKKTMSDKRFQNDIARAIRLYEQYKNQRP